MQFPHFMSACQSAFENGNLQNCKPLGLSLADWGSISGLILFFLAAIGLFAKPILSWCKTTEGRPRTFWGMKRQLRVIVRENRRLFNTFGPKSGANDVNADAFDLGSWRSARVTIDKNNQVIAEILRNNSSKIPKRHRNIFDRWLDHIDAFSAHLRDQSVSYTSRQFPKEIDRVIGM